ncbi:MAG: hypothetical protein UHS50_11475, partial [Bacteroidaceae bacterium]|nr:hypothetical protein [Bacteroidaceae bacterium]
MQKRHLNRSVYLEGTSIVVHRPTSTVNHSSFRHDELVSASGSEPTPIPVLGEILKQVQDDLLDIVQLLSDFQTMRHAELVSAPGCEPTPAHFPYLQKANVMLHSYSVYMQKINVIPYFHFACIHRGNIVPHSYFHTLHSINVVSHLRFAGLKSHKKADKAT